MPRFSSVTSETAFATLALAHAECARMVDAVTRGRTARGQLVTPIVLA